ncbi:MAG: DUF2812 domain-containing protein [Clostridia bacterium]|nr:DUF2812 domain-containing protein [Clostridia bacterium]
MKNKITVFKAFVCRKKEETYLNEMNKRGWKLSMLRFGFYTFIKTEPNEFMTVLHFAERQYQTTFLRTVTECGCEVAHQESAGKYILFYINAPVGSENIDFLTDNQSKLNFNKRLSLQYKREFIPLFAVIPFTVLPVLMSIPITAMIFRTAPEDPYSLMKDYLFGYIGNAVLFLCGLICATMGAYILVLYSKTKREIKRISNEMKIFE